VASSVLLTRQQFPPCGFVVPMGLVSGAVTSVSDPDKGDPDFLEQAVKKRKAAVIIVMQPYLISVAGLPGY